MLNAVKKIKNEMGADPEEPRNTIDFPSRDVIIAKLAYYKAQQRGFEPGYELDDWLEAEQELML